MTTHSPRPSSEAKTSLARLLLLALGATACSPQVVEAVGGEDCVCMAGSGAAGGAGGSAAASGAGGGSGAASGGAGTGGTLLVHRYSFNGASDAVVDSVSANDGKAINALAANGSLTLTGQAFPMQYVDLPSFTLSKLSEATLEMWITWTGGGGPWQRIFDFGEDLSGEHLGPEIRMPPAMGETFGGLLYSGRTYLYLTPRSEPMPSNVMGNRMRLAYLKPVPLPMRVGGGVHMLEDALEAAEALPAMREVHVAVSIGGGRMSLYMDGGPIGSRDITGPLAAIHDVNSWLGRSQYATDSQFAGTFNEFRIYRVALSPAQITQSYDAGPDAVAIP